MRYWIYPQYYGGGKGPTPARRWRRCICQEQHRRGYCTETGCPYALSSEQGPTLRGVVWKWIRRVMRQCPKDTEEVK